MRTLAAALLLTATLAACGGGGSSTATSGGTGTTVTLDTLSGVLSFSGSILPDPATTAQKLNVSMQIDLVGSVSPTASTIAIPYTVTRTTGTPAAYIGLATMAKSTTGFSGVASLQLPAGQPVGVNTYCVQLLPADAYTYKGTIPGPSCTTVTINP